MLFVSEVAEAMEGERKNLMDDKLPHRRMAEVEIADVLIRVFDYAGGFRHDLDRGIAHRITEPFTTLNELALLCSIREGATGNRGAALLEIVRDIIHVADEENDIDSNSRVVGFALAMVVFRCCAYAGAFGYDLDGAVREKRAFNATRADHKAEARLAPGGKAF